MAQSRLVILYNTSLHNSVFEIKINEKGSSDKSSKNIYIRYALMLSPSILQGNAGTQLISRPRSTLYRTCFAHS